MEIRDLERWGFNCLNCANSKSGSAPGGGFGVSIECSLLKSQLWLQDKDKIRNCKDFITYEQLERKQKLNKITKNVNTR